MAVGQAGQAGPPEDGRPPSSNAVPLTRWDWQVCLPILLLSGQPHEHRALFPAEGNSSKQLVLTELFARSQWAPRCQPTALVPASGPSQSRQRRSQDRRHHPMAYNQQLTLAGRTRLTKVPEEKQSRPTCLCFPRC